MKKLAYSFFTILVLGTVSCKKDFFDINENPNSPTQVTNQLLLPRILNATAGRMATSYNYAALWTGYWARSGTYGPSIEEESYNITTTFQAGQWSGWYDILSDADIMEKQGVTSGSKFYQGVAKVIKAIGFMYLVDQYNNVPYSQAFKGQGNLLPAYDSGAAIYADLQVQLEAAAKLFADAEITPEIPTVDILFGGDTDMWRKLVNTQRLKLLIHQSQVVQAATVTTVVGQINADGSGYLQAGETAAVNPGYTISANQLNPFWDAYKTDELGTLVDDYNRANNYVLNKYRNNNDSRYQYVFSRAQTPLGGNTYYGYNYGENVPNSAPKAINSSDVAGPGLAKSETQDQWLFTSVESLFLQAEAMQRGWISGDAKSEYNAAITESFNYLGAPGAATYIVSNTAIVNFDAATDKVRQIVMQKYLALTGINNFEAYVDYRRLGVPMDLPLSLATSRGSNIIPLRLLYPQAEYQYNAANVAAQGSINAQTSTIFWDR
ncbi:SusD/RagB family nutrient-binding outer membrane lipoprotein [uncultured Mucilaginibacter sp.]|uniref:SusD/RagB family nutrient-binding outer membrane lipoprotein n=1 Tax=uncultured Mucilaginibacter sp. TaxID=797541 RepID=UPI0025FD4050|nr:SusD/RagB family nutrient-binding outer membrane lipoprotein [uncultured Mucilaginibacter sp.]